MMKSSQECACRVLDDHRADTSRKGPLVILTPNSEVHNVRQIVGGSMGLGAECYGATWLDEDGQMVTVRKFEDEIPDFHTEFALAVCNGGQSYTTQDVQDMKRWRTAAKITL